MLFWLTTIFSVVIILGIFAWIVLSIYQKISQIRGKKKDKKEIENKEDKKNFNFVFNNSG